MATSGQAPATNEAPASVDAPIARLVAEQIETGDYECPEDVLVIFEGCLLFQGALAAHGGTDPVEALDDPGFQTRYVLAVIRSTPILSSRDTYRFQTGAREFTKPGSDPEICLEVRYGLCGNQSAIGLALIEAAGIPARPIEFYFDDAVSGKRNSHVALEVFIDGEWRYADGTHGSYWLEDEELATTEAVLSMPDPRETAVWNKGLYPFDDPEALNYPPFEHLEATADILRGGVGEIHLDLVGTENLEHLPSYVGDNQADGRSAGVEYVLAHSDGSTLIVEVSGIGGSGSLCLDEVCEDLEEAPQTMEFPFSASGRLRVEGEDVGYAVIDAIRVVSS